LEKVKAATMREGGGSGKRGISIIAKENPKSQKSKSQKNSKAQKRFAIPGRAKGAETYQPWATPKVSGRVENRGLKAMLLNWWFFNRE
jgi:hypothetical protein